jgi:hypothetical protein
MDPEYPSLYEIIVVSFTFTFIVLAVAIFLLPTCQPSPVLAWLALIRQTEVQF